eukprot:63918-Chlamydomonas_euryale.AAC.1
MLVPTRVHVLNDAASKHSARSPYRPAGDATVASPPAPRMAASASNVKRRAAHHHAASAGPPTVVTSRSMGAVRWVPFGRLLRVFKR